MKRKLISIVFLAMIFACSLGLNAQNFYLKYDIGYATPIAEQSVLGFYDLNEGEEALPFIQQNKISFGQGYQMNLGLGYKFSEQISGEMNLSYLWGAKRDSEIATSTDYFYRSLRGSLFSAIPSLVLNIPSNKENLDFYTRMGLMVTLSPRILYNTKTLEDNDSTEYQQEYVMSGSLALGFNGAIGLKWQTGPIDYFVELDFRALSYAPTKRSMKSSTLNGESNIDALTIRERETVFLDKIEVSNPALIIDDQPLEVLKSSYPFSSLSLNFGIIITL